MNCRFVSEGVNAANYVDQMAMTTWSPGIFPFLKKLSPYEIKIPARSLYCAALVWMDMLRTCGVWSHFVSLHRTAQNNSIIYLAGQGFKSLALTLDFWHLFFIFKIIDLQLRIEILYCLIIILSRLICTRGYK